MDGSRFDHLARALSGAGSRRGLLRLVAALPLLAGLADVPEAAADACTRKCRRKKNNKKARRRCRKRCQKPQPPACVTSADCPPGEVCEDGQCIPEPDQCTTAGDCDACEACDDGACVSTCEQGEVCREDQCCQPLTACPGGRDCGVMDDQCGGLLRCGPDTCDDGFFCFDNRCFCPDGYTDCGAVCCEPDAVCDQGGECCTPNCDDKACGDPDGCGGVCQEGSCPTCHFCREGSCEQEFPGTFCGGPNAETICLFDGRCGAFTCEDNSDCPGSCSCATSQFSDLCYEGSSRGCPGAEPCVNFNCPPRFECRVCPGGERCIPLCSG